MPIDDVSTDTFVSADHSVQVLGRLARRELWQAIDRELADDNERLAAHQLFVAGLSPREILARHPDKFGSAFDIYRVTANVIDRLRRSQTVRRKLEECSSHACTRLTQWDCSPHCGTRHGRGVPGGS